MHAYVPVAPDSAALGWSLDVEQDAEWLLLSIRPPDREFPPACPKTLAAEVWALLTKRNLKSIVLRMQFVRFLNSELLGQLVVLHKRVHANGGICRLAGLTVENQQVLQIAQLDGRFPQISNAHEAIAGNGSR